MSHASRTTAMESAVDRIFPNVSLSEFPELSSYSYKQIISGTGLQIYSDFGTSIYLIQHLEGRKATLPIDMVLNLPYLISIGTAAWGVWTGNYWLLFALPSAFIGVVQSNPGFAKKMYLLGILAGLAFIYITLTSPTTVTTIGLNWFVGWALSSAARLYVAHRVASLVRVSEKLFCAFYKAGAMGFNLAGTMYIHKPTNKKAG